MVLHYTGLVSLFRYWRASGADHFYTTNKNEIGTTTPGTVGHHQYTSEGTQCLIYSTQVTGSVPLYRYFHNTAVDHFYTTNTQEIGTTTPGQTGKNGYVSEGITGYCFPSSKPGTIPLYRYYNPSAYDHFYTTNPQEIGTTKFGYKSEGIACYVLPYYG